MHPYQYAPIFTSPYTHSPSQYDYHYNPYLFNSYFPREPYLTEGRPFWSTLGHLHFPKKRPLDPKIYTTFKQEGTSLWGMYEDQVEIASYRDVPEFKKGTCHQKACLPPPINTCKEYDTPCLKTRQSEVKIYLVVQHAPLNEALKSHYDDCLEVAKAAAIGAAAKAYDETYPTAGPEAALAAALKAGALAAWAAFESCMVAFVGPESLKKLFIFDMKVDQKHTSDWKTVQIG